jgi:hypothetical protein
MLPPRGKPLLVLPILFGGVVSLAAVFLARSMNVSRTKLAIGFVSILAAAGYGHAAWQSYQRAARQAVAQPESLEQQMALAMLKETAGTDTELVKRYEAELAQHKPSWQGYLAQRLRPAGQWARPWPVVYFIVELLLAGVAALFGVRRLWTVANAAPLRDDPTFNTPASLPAP